jgi:hypothetical protein
MRVSNKLSSLSLQVSSFLQPALRLLPSANLLTTRLTVLLSVLMNILLAILVVSSSLENARAEYTAVTPPGRRAFVIRQIQAQVPGQFDSSGNLLEFTFNEVLTGERVGASFAPVRALMEQIKEVDPQAAATIDFGTIRFDADIQANVTGLALAWGFPGDIMVGAILPIWRASVDLRGPGFINSDSLRKLGNSLRENAAQSTDPERSKILAQILAQIPQLEGENLQNILVSDFGYAPLGHWSGEGPGDLELFVHKRFLARDDLRMAARVGGSLPTGRSDDPDQFTDVPFGAGHATFFGEGLMDVFTFRQKLVLSLALKSTLLAPKTKTVRAYDELPISSNRQNLHVSPGPRFQLKAGADFAAKPTFHLFSNLLLEQRLRGSLRESSLSPDWISDTRSAESRQIEIGTRFTTVPLYFDGTFSIPFSVSLSLTRFLFGRNSEKVDQGYAELALYF